MTLTCVLHPFDKVLCRDADDMHWYCTFLSYIEPEAKFPYGTVAAAAFKQCIPYNEDTAHLAMTTDAPEHQYIIIYNKTMKDESADNPNQQD